MSHPVTAAFTNELNRLRARGLSMPTAMSVIEGELDEESEVAVAENDRRAEPWAKSQENREASFTPKWDYAPQHYYRSMDGNTLPKQVNPADFQIVCADVSDVTSHLAFHSTRSEGSWSEEWQAKTAGIAYRWANGLPVTPPLIATHQEKITIVGGMHRFHLASHYAASRLPLLVRRSNLASVLSTLKSAKAK